MKLTKNTSEEAVEKRLVRLVREAGGEVRKVVWPGRRFAPDRFVMLPRGCFWVELKNPATILTFPSNPRERGQAREHALMARYGQEVHVIGTFEAVEALIRRNT